MSSTPTLVKYQIVCLEHGDQIFYGEVIQVVESRQLCWVRPLALAPIPTPENYFGGKAPWIDLRQTADVVYPLCLFRPALDTEVLPLLSQLLASTPDGSAEEILISVTHTSEYERTGRHLRQFLDHVWQADPSLFCSKSG